MGGTQTRPHQNFEIVPYSSTASVCLRGHNRACRIAAELHQQLLSERSSRRQISAAALGAGVRAANAAKTLATVAQSRASSDRRFAQRDALQEAQKRDAAEMKFKIELSAHIKKIALHVALCEALRHRLGLAQAQQKVQELKILKM